MNPKEQQIIEWGIQNGKTKEETKQAIIRFRTTGSPANPNLAQPTEPKEPGYFQQIKESAEIRADRFGQILKRDTGIVEKGVQVFGQGAGLAADVIEKGAEQIPGVKQAFGAIGSGIQWLATSDYSPIKALGDQIGKSEMLQEATTLYDTDPDFKDTVDGVANAVRLGADVQLISDAFNVTKNVVGKIKNKVATIPPPDIAGAIGKVKSLVTEQGIVTAPKTIDEIVGKIIQAKPKDIPQATRALSSVDTTGVKTYAELGTKVQNRTSEIGKALDNYLNQQSGIYKMKDLSVSQKVGNTVVKQNYVDSALKQLQELYSKIQEPANAVRIKQLIAKAKKEGLTAKEINDIAKEYGREFGRKAFSKMGDPLTSVNAQAFENVRKGVKTTARDLIEGDVAKILDERMWDLISTQRSVQKMADKVAQLYQRVRERGLMERIANKLGTAVDLLTLKTGSGFLSRFLPSNVGLKTMNSIAIEEALVKNLQLLDDLLKGIDEGTISSNKLIDDVVKAMQETNSI